MNITIFTRASFSFLCNKKKNNVNKQDLAMLPRAGNHGNFFDFFKETVSDCLSFGAPSRKGRNSMQRENKHSLIPFAGCSLP